jgi:CRISPR/Cas system CSM-associated protein Csm4 (group 5 of RAMP superfamily)
MCSRNNRVPHRVSVGVPYFFLAIVLSLFVFSRDWISNAEQQNRGTYLLFSLSYPMASLLHEFSRKVYYYLIESEGRVREKGAFQGNPRPNFFSLFY